MKLACDLEIVYILAQTNGGDARSKRSRAILSIGRKGGESGSSRKGEELHLIVSTVKNVNGLKYKVKDNITNIFGKFLKDGKATIRFKEPAHDLSISKADPSKLKEFLTLLKLSPKDQQTVSIAPLLPPKMKDLDKPPTKLVVKTRGDYPIQGFPSTLETIQANEIGLHRIDRRILELMSLRCLDLSGNDIKTLPEEMKVLALAELKIAGNSLSEFPIGLCYGNLAENLKTLDVSRNKLDFLPHTFPQFKSLIQLKLDCNKLQLLPRTFGKLSSLRYLSASSNHLAVLPHSFSKLRLESLDLFGNPFQASGLVRRCKNLGHPGLMELAARAVKQYRLSYDPQTVPVMLCHYLDSAKRCLCNKACFEVYLHYIAGLDLHKVSTTVTAVDQMGSTRVPIELFLCSAKCLKLWK